MRWLLLLVPSAVLATWVVAALSTPAVVRDAEAVVRAARSRS